MKDKLFESESKVMEIIWDRGPVSAKEISLIAADTIGWNKNTTYTVIKKLEAKGFITIPGRIPEKYLYERIFLDDVQR